MYEQRILGDHKGYSLINSMLLICSMYFGMRTEKKTHCLKWSDVRLRLDPQIGAEWRDRPKQWLMKTQKTQGFNVILTDIVFFIVI